jgi:catechol 2,3-dioxygenase-like lactoylglutathione lyase family enzyme
MMGGMRIQCERWSSYQANMKVLSLGWLGVRTARAAEMSEFYRDVLGLELLAEDSTSTRFRLADGTEAHVYSAGDSDHCFWSSPGCVDIPGSMISMRGVTDGKTKATQVYRAIQG